MSVNEVEPGNAVSRRAAVRGNSQRPSGRLVTVRVRSRCVRRSLASWDGNSFHYHSQIVSLSLLNEKKETRRFRFGGIVRPINRRGDMDYRHGGKTIERPSRQYFRFQNSSVHSLLSTVALEYFLVTPLANVTKKKEANVQTPWLCEKWGSKQP